MVNPKPRIQIFTFKKSIHFNILQSCLKDSNYADGYLFLFRSHSATYFLMLKPPFPSIQSTCSRFPPEFSIHFFPVMNPFLMNPVFPVHSILFSIFFPVHSILSQIPWFSPFRPCFFVNIPQNSTPSAVDRAPEGESDDHNQRMEVES